MQCFRHHERAAVGICRHCGKAGCAECSNDTGEGIACSEICAAELRDSYALRLRLKRTFGIGSRPPVPATVSMYAFFGAILLLVGTYLSFSGGRFDYLSFAMAAVFFAMSWLSYRRYREFCATC